MAAVLALLAIHAAIAIGTLRQKSVTVDEVAHLPAGISYWQTHTFELYHHNPPLVKLLAALPALAAQPKVVYTKSWLWSKERGLPLNPWAFGWDFMYANAARYHAIYFWARLTSVAWSLLAGWIIFRWSNELFGSPAGVLGAGLWTFCPNTIAHAGMVTTDMGSTSLGFVATYVFWRYLRRPTWRWAAAAGVMLGLAELTKFSLLLLCPLWPTLWLTWRVLRRNAEEIEQCPRWRGLAHLGAMLLISVFVINLGYGFEQTGTRLGEFPFLSRSLTRPRQTELAPPAFHPKHPWRPVIVERQNRFFGTWLARLPVPLPRQYVEGFDEQKLESEGIGGQGYPVFLCGELRRTGWWWYYFFALAVKVPLGTWLLTLAALAFAVRCRAARASFGDELVLLAPVVAVLVVMSFLTDINLGLRYVLPIFPFWFVLVSRLAILSFPRGWPGAANSAKVRRGFVVAIALPLAWNVAECGLNHPDHLAYFNELVGGPEHGRHYLIDSNLDWGQDLLALADWLAQRRPVEPIGLAYFGNVDPSILAASGRPIHFELAPPRRLDDLRLPTEDRPEARQQIIERLGLREGPQPGLFAVSVNLVMGLPFRVRDQLGIIWSAEQDAYGYFRKLTPIGRAGRSILIYRVSPSEAHVLRVKLGLPPLESRTAEPDPASTPSGSEPTR